MPTLRTILNEILLLLRDSFKPAAGRFLPFDSYPTRFRPPMKKASR